MSAWIVASLVSALFLGAYELFTKHAVRANAVVPVLFLSTLTGASIWTFLMLLSAVRPGSLPPSLVVDPISVFQHLQLALKSAIVAGSWMFTYFALKHLPLSLGSPIRATSPLWTLVGAVLLLGERPGTMQTIGILTTLASFVGLSMAGAREGVHFHRSKWVAFILLGAISGAASSLYDKYLLGHLRFTVPTVQAWFSVYLALFFLPFAMGWKYRWWPRNEFQWRWSIPLIALALLASDYVYFGALRQPEAMVALVMSLRRGSTLIAFMGGLLFFSERHGWRKLPAVLGILVGIALALLGS